MPTQTWREQREKTIHLPNAQLERLVEQSKQAKGEARFRDDADLALVIGEMALEILALREELAETKQCNTILAFPEAHLR